MAYDFQKLDAELAKTKDWFVHEIVALRTGRANPVLVEDILIESYGSRMPMKHVAAISTEDARTLLIRPWDKSNILAIESAIRASGLGLQPIVTQDVVRIVLPELSEERRASLRKLLSEKLEQAKVAVRKYRDEIWSDIQTKEREGVISEDDKFRLKDEMQKKIDAANKQLEEISAKKQEEISA